MSDHRTAGEAPELEHDKFHSSLEIDDSVGWRPFVVPAILILFVIGVLLSLVLY